MEPIVQKVAVEEVGVKIDAKRQHKCIKRLFHLRVYSKRKVDVAECTLEKQKVLLQNRNFFH